MEEIDLENEELEAFLMRLKQICQDSKLEGPRKVERIKLECDDLFEET
jgi:hypothetical protein